MIVMDEKKYAEKCIADKHYSAGITYTVNVLTRYYMNCKNKDEPETKELVYGFMQKAYPKYLKSHGYWKGIIDRAMKTASDRPLIECGGLNITRNELAEIEPIKPKRLRRLAFTALVLAKFGNTVRRNRDNKVYGGMDMLFRISKIQCPKSERARLLNELIATGYISNDTGIGGNSIVVKKVDAVISDTAFLVKDIEDCWLEYRRFKGDKIIKCKRCGKLVYGNSDGTRKYCNPCAELAEIPFKIRICLDCKEYFLTNIKNNNPPLCKKCSKERRKIRYKAWYERQKTRCE